MAYLIAHRGASADAPENTLAAFQHAWQQGADGVEGDFRLTRDGRIVCIHDADLQRVAETARTVGDTDLADLQTYDVGRWKGAGWVGERIPSLKQVLENVPSGKLAVLELKCGPEIVAPLSEVLAGSSIDPANVLLISLVDETVAECKRQLPRVKCHWLTGYQETARDAPETRWHPTAAEVIAAVRRLGADGFGSQALPEHFDAVFVAKLRAAGIDEFHVWTVDDPAVARFYIDLGTWGITTNRPAQLRTALREA